MVEPNAEERAKWREMAEPVGTEFVGDVADADFIQVTRDAIARIEAGFHAQ